MLYYTLFFRHVQGKTKQSLSKPFSYFEINDYNSLFLKKKYEKTQIWTICVLYFWGCGFGKDFYGFRHGDGNSLAVCI